jgi:hypothetical protein
MKEPRVTLITIRKHPVTLREKRELTLSIIKIGARVLIDIRELDGFIDTNKTRCTY